MSQPVTKFRPVLTAAQIEHILELAKTHQSGISNLSMSLISTLSPFQAKIANAAITPAYIIQPVKPKVDSLEALGGASTQPVTSTSFQDKETYWKSCYIAYKSNPVACSLEQIVAAKEHMYLNDMMSQEEIADFEAGSEEANNG